MTKEELKTELDKIDKNIFWEIEGTGNTEPILQVINSNRFEHVVSPMDKEMTAKEFIDMIVPEHGRTSCSDEDVSNGLFSRDGKNWHGRCSRCLLLDILKDGKVPDEFEFYECNG